MLTDAVDIARASEDNLMTSRAFIPGKIMANDGDPSWWIAPAVGFVSGAAGWLVRSLLGAYKQGQSIGEMAEWRKNIDEKSRSIDVVMTTQAQMALRVSELAIRLGALEVNGTRASEKLERVVDRREIKEEFERVHGEIEGIREQLNRLLISGRFVPPPP